MLHFSSLKIHSKRKLFIINLFCFVKWHPASSKVENVQTCYHMTIQVFQRIMHHLEMMHRGSILHNCSSFAALILFSVHFSHLEHFDICQAGKTKRNRGGIRERRSKRVRQWWGLVGRPQDTVLVIHPLLILFLVIN